MPIADPIHLIVQPKSSEPLSAQQLASIARVANAEAAEVDADGGARFAFTADRYSRQAARGNLEMAARMQLGARWHTRYEIVEVP